MAEKIMEDGTIIQISRGESHALANDYFSHRRAVYQFLRSAMPERFRGDADKATGMIKSGGYHSQWSHLDEREGTYRVASRLLKTPSLTFLVRNGESYMRVQTDREKFPAMEVLSFENSDEYGRSYIGAHLSPWNVNETEFCESWSASQPRLATAKR